jgi:outer membrane protein insertion porin family
VGLLSPEENILISISGLKVGERIMIPGDNITKAIKNLWEQGLFSEITISIERKINDIVFLNINLEERPRLSKFAFDGVKKSEADDIREQIKLEKGNQVTDNVIINAKNRIINYFNEKGFYNVEVDIKQEADTTIANHVILYFNVKKNNKFKISNIDVEGNQQLASKKITHTMKDTKQKKWYRIFKASKYSEEDFRTDKQSIINKYNEEGYRDMRILKDSVYISSEKTLGIKLWIEEGKKFYFRKITWTGNSKYKTEDLANLLGIKKGDLYNQTLLEEKLFVDPAGLSSLYLDNGYLFFSATPVEILVENDSIDIEIRIYEGKQARINNVIITGNTKTNEHVVRREIRTKPGELFSRADIIRTQRELATLGYFDPEKLDVRPTPNPAQGTVDLEYIVEEKPSDQIELSGGWGARMVVGTLGVVFNNFSAKNFFKKNAWQPLPSGDGQRLSVRAQTNGIYYQAYSASFVEPWLGGKKPNSLSTSVYYTIQSNGLGKTESGRADMHIFGVSTGLGKRLNWPDDYFTLYHEISYQRYTLNNYTYNYMFSFSDGTSNNISWSTTLSRNSVDQPIFPRRGSQVSLSLQLTPPYSAFSNKDYSTMSNQEKYKFIEYHKWKFSSLWYTKLAGDLILNTKLEFGFLGLYNQQIGPSPFEGFNMGGDGLTTYNLYGKETVSLRGYGNGSITPLKGGNIYNKFCFELRYPLSLNPNATIYVLTFAEGGNSWNKFNEFKPFDIKRAAGVGVRIFLPMFGKLGVDWGYGFDEPVIPGENKSQFHFIIGQNF